MEKILTSDLQSEDLKLMQEDIGLVKTIYFLKEKSKENISRHLEIIKRT